MNDLDKQLTESQGSDLDTYLSMYIDTGDVNDDLRGHILLLCDCF